MNILTIGAGVVGVTYSWQLREAGFHITHFVRRSKIERYKEHGITIRCIEVRPWETEYCMELYRPDFVDEFSAGDGFDYILVSVNSNQLTGVLPTLKKNSGDATILFLQNMRFDSDEILDQYLDRRQYVICYPFRIGGVREDNTIETVIFRSRFSHTVVGEQDGTITERIKKIAAMFMKADLHPKIITNIIPYIRTQYVWAACSLAALLKAGTFDRFTEIGSLKESCQAMREGWEICKLQSINPQIVAPACYFHLPFFILLPFLQWFYKKPGMKEIVEGHVKHSSPEMRDMYYSLLEEGEKNGIPMPVYKRYKLFVEEYFWNLNEQAHAANG